MSNWLLPGWLKTERHDERAGSRLGRLLGSHRRRYMRRFDGRAELGGAVGALQALWTLRIRHNGAYPA